MENASDLPTILSITEDELNLDALLVAITLPSTGAAAVFSGIVRGITARDDPHETLYLEYEAYRPMAEELMERIAAEIRARWPAVEGPQSSPCRSTPAAHRDTGVFEAARYGIDRLKEIVPIWKKEVGPDGAFWVEGEHPSESESS